MADYTKDDFGNRMKTYEASSETFVNMAQPICVRIDGKRFSKFTKSMDKPFDDKMQLVMQTTTYRLMEYFHADVAYTQSDEISIVFSEQNTKSFPFNGRVQKNASVFASKATSFFMQAVHKYFDQKYFDAAPCMDARVFNVPNNAEASNQILWRIQDASRNSVSSAFRHLIGHKIMQNKSKQEMIDFMLERGVIFKEKYTPFQRTGTLYYRKTVELNNEETNISYVRRVINFMSGENYAEQDFASRVNLIY